MYRREWITWRYAVKQGDDGRAELKSWLAGHGVDQDPGYKLVLSEAEKRWCVQVLAPVLKGEWVEQSRAEQQREELGPVTEIVLCGSPDEAALIAVGRNLKDLLR